MCIMSTMHTEVYMQDTISKLIDTAHKHNCAALRQQLSKIKTDIPEYYNINTIPYGTVLDYPITHGVMDISFNN